MRYCVFLLPFLFQAIFAEDESQAVVPERHFAMFEKYCLECHDSLSEKGGVNLEDLSFKLDSVEQAEKWQKILNSMNSGEMPPEDEQQVTNDEKAGFLDDLSHEMVDARELLCDTGGVITMRRLNRREYENTVYDLLGVRIDAEALPDDGGSGGFDTTGASLFFSSDQFEQYLDLAYEALDSTYQFGKKPPKHTLQRESETSANKRFANATAKLKRDFSEAKKWRATKGTKKPSDFGFIDESDVKFHERLYNRQYSTYLRYLKRNESKTGLLLNTLFSGAVLDVVKIPDNWQSGEYLITVRVATLPGAKSHQTFLEHGELEKGSLGGEMNLIGCTKVTGTMEKPQTLKIPISIRGGKNRNFGLRQRQPNSRAGARATYLQSLSKTGLGPDPALWIDSVGVEGPIYDSWPTSGVTALFFKGMWWKQPDEDKYAKAVIKRFATRAFRIKKPSPEFLEHLNGLYFNAKKRGETFQNAVRDPLAAIMASPGFLYMIEPTAGAEKRALTPSEFAVRLAYFLWSAPPDNALYAKAKSGDLLKPAVLARQTKRMLNDPRANDFIASFTHQWLQMERLDFFQFSATKHPQFDDSVKEAARQEVFQTIRSILKEKRPLSDLLKADHALLNDVLADYYGIPGVEGSHFQKVMLPAGSPRGGLLGMAAIHAMGSDGNNSSVVERGAWVMRKLLHDPPPPAPANVPQLSRVQGKLLTPREQLSAHMEEAQCAQCHRKIDPIGHGLENFDAAGQWRDELLLTKVVGKKVKKRKRITVDSSGQLPDGNTFSDYFGLRDQIATKQDAFSRSFTEALIEYALGRPYGFSDESLREKIIKRGAAKNGEMLEMILALIQSKPFQTKK